MNLHAFLDTGTVTMTALGMTGNKYFSKSIESPSYEELFESSHVSLPEITDNGVNVLTASTPVGELYPAFLAAQLRGPEYPTIIYMHGNQEKPFDFSKGNFSTFRNILITSDDTIEANIIGIRAAYHTLKLKQFVKEMRYLATFKAMTMLSAVVTESLITALRTRGFGKFIVAGISLGGWATNLHKAWYDTADEYVPLLAGAALGDIFFHSVYRKTISKRARTDEIAVIRSLNFERLLDRRPLDNVHPLLGRYDQIIRYDRQKLSYRGNPVKVVNKGHITAAMAADVLRAHILQYV